MVGAAAVEEGEIIVAGIGAVVAHNRAASVAAALPDNLRVLIVAESLSGAIGDTVRSSSAALHLIADDGQRAAICAPVGAQATVGSIESVSGGGGSPGIVLIPQPSYQVDVVMEVPMRIDIPRLTPTRISKAGSVSDVEIVVMYGDNASDVGNIQSNPIAARADHGVVGTFTSCGVVHDPALSNTASLDARCEFDADVGEGRIKDLKIIAVRTCTAHSSLFE